MLVTCQNCGISVAAAMSRCVACGTDLRPSGEEAEKANLAICVQMLEESQSKEAVFRHLIDRRGLSELNADTVFTKGAGILRERAKSHGKQLVISGFTLLGIAVGIYVIFAGMVVALGCLALGLPMVVIGAIKARTGWNITGHDDE